MPGKASPMEKPYHHTPRKTERLWGKIKIGVVVYMENHGSLTSPPQSSGPLRPSPYPYNLSPQEIFGTNEILCWYQAAPSVLRDGVFLNLVSRKADAPSDLRAGEF